MKHLISKGAKVYFTARSEAKADFTRDYISAHVPGAALHKLTWIPMDLSDIKSVIKAADAIASKEQRLDILSE